MHTDEPPPPLAPLRRTGRPRRVVLAGCGALTFLLGVFALEIYFGIVRATDAPVAEVRAFLDATARGDLAAARARLSEAGRRQLTEERLAALIVERPDFFRARDMTLTNRKVRDDFCTLRGTLTGPSGNAVPCAFELIREEGGWRIGHLSWSPPPRR